MRGADRPGAVPKRQHKKCNAYGINSQTMIGGAIGLCSGLTAANLLRNPTATQHQIVPVKNRSLAGGDGALGCVQFYPRLSSIYRSHCRGRAGVVVTNLCRDFQFLRGGVESNPVATINHELVTLEG